ncbi:MAG: type III-B CRISPR module-associated protein Cmr3 [Blastocatellia bacterium]|nr:type III-B CRISPR module-associated protein Cmr3 [Blastocatellia bacterium]
MTVWILEPRDPIIFRDGRPFGDPGARAASLSFPFPSTIAGGVRTRAGLDAQGNFQKGKISEVKKIAIKGPFLVELAETGSIQNWLMPAPMDLVILNNDSNNETTVNIKKLVPINMPENSFTDLQTDFPNLSLVGMTQSDNRKPHKPPPRFWYWKKLEEWLNNAQDKLDVNLSDLGHKGPSLDIRTHVSILNESQTAREGALFQTQGLEFTYQKQADKKLANLTRLALAVQTEANLREGVAMLGGERRIVNWHKNNDSIPFAKCPDQIKKQILCTKACRVLLLTPGCFKDICQPEYLITPHKTLTPQIKAIRVERPQVISGWDFETNKPKATRRLAPAGTVFFLKFDEKTTNEKELENWVDKIWLSSVSDDEQSRLDSFGLAVLGTWSGKNEIMEVK